MRRGSRLRSVNGPGGDPDRGTASAARPVRLGRSAHRSCPHAQPSDESRRGTAPRPSSAGVAGSIAPSDVAPSRTSKVASEAKGYVELATLVQDRSEEARVGKECVSTGISRGGEYI